MSPSVYTLAVSELQVTVRRKRIRNFHIRVVPPDGAVTVSTPLHLDREAVRAAVEQRLQWIRKHRARFASQPQHAPHEYRTGEIHWFFGRTYRLEVVAADVRGARITGISDDMIKMIAPAASTFAARRRALQRWYRSALEEFVVTARGRCESVVGAQANEIRYKRMRTLWGSCNTRARRVWLNVELAKRPSRSIEYVLVHELVHLHERGHNRRFYDLMTRAMPDWKQRRSELNEVQLQRL